MASIWDREDTGQNPDKQLIERLTRNLGLSRIEVLQEMSRYAEQQRRNSILGALSYDVNTQKNEDAALEDAEQQYTHEEFAKQNLKRKIKTLEFFSLNELGTKLRDADWLEYVCFEPDVPDLVQQQNHLLSGTENDIDTLLKSAFDFTDINDSVSINKILEESAQAHMQKIVGL